MFTYFSRHTSALDVDKSTLDMLWNEDYIAIHYPKSKENKFEQSDATSIDPNDYERNARSSLRTLIELAENGGYVFAVYRNKIGGKIGYIKPDTQIELLNGSWGSINSFEGRPAVLKALKLSFSKNLNASECISLTTVQPRQGTFCRWHKVGTRVMSLLNGTNELSIGSLTPDLQEVMCMEFLRTQSAVDSNLPRLQTTLSPVGRTMKDVDIIGLSVRSRLILAQVTYFELGNAGWKLERLDKYTSKENDTILFCKCDAPHFKHHHQIFPIDSVFELFCLKSEIGKNWLNQVLHLPCVPSPNPNS